MKKLEKGLSWLLLLAMVLTLLPGTTFASAVGATPRTGYSGTSGAELQAIIDGMTAGDTLKITSPSEIFLDVPLVIRKNIRIEGGSIVPSPAWGYDDTMVYIKSSAVTMDSVTFDAKSKCRVLYVDNGKREGDIGDPSNLTLTGCSILSGASGGTGAGLYYSDGGTLTIDGGTTFISTNVRWGYQRRMKKGTFIPASLPYGYILINKKIEISEEQAIVVRRIFHDYLSGINTTKIAAALRCENIPGKNGTVTWGATSIREILGNEKYIGDSLWQKYYTTDTLPYQCKLNRGEREQYYAANTHPAIITKEIYQAAQALRGKRGSKINVEPPGTRSPLQRKLFCGSCGSLCRRRVVRGIAYWICRTRFANASACPVTQIPETEIYAAFLRLYDKLRHEGRPILEEMLSQLRNIREKRLLWSKEIVALNHQICEITNQVRMLAQMKGGVDPDFFIGRGNTLAEELRTAKLAKERLLEAKADDTVPKTAELLEILDDAPDELDEFDQGWFDELIEKIIVESGTRLRFRLKNGLELTETIERTVR